MPGEEVDKMDVPLQLLTTVTTGAIGAVFGAAVPLPGKPVQPSMVAVTVYVPAAVTVIEDKVSAVLHNNVPADPVDKVDVPLQLLTTVTTGAAGNVFGAAVPLPERLVQPSTVAVTE
jgi:hypothetical protein